MCTPKEPHFFAYGEGKFHFEGPKDNQFTHSSLSRRKYEALFAEARHDQLRGDASTSSLYVPRAARRIEQYVPEAKMIILLRNPVDRAFSNYLLLLRDGREPCNSFREALDREPSRINQNWEHGWHYRRMGFYYNQVRRFYEHFDQAQIRIFLFDNFTADPVSIAQDVFCFLGVDDSFVPDTSLQHNPSGCPRSRTLHWLLQLAGVGAQIRSVLPDVIVEMVGHHAGSFIQGIRRLKKKVIHHNLERPSLSSAVRTRLLDVYRDDIHRLEDLIDRDLSHWLDHPA